MDLTTIISIIIIVGVFFVIRTFLTSNISFEDAQKEIEKGGLIIDVRTEAEFSDAHVPGAINVPLDEFETKFFPDIIKSKDQSILLYCQSGGRSSMACHVLRKRGYTNVFNMGSFSRAKKCICIQ